MQYAPAWLFGKSIPVGRLVPQAVGETRAQRSTILSKNFTENFLRKILCKKNIKNQGLDNLA